MLRRQFMKASMGPTLAALAEPGGLSAAARSLDPDAPEVMRSYTHEDHRQRLENIAECERGIRKCMRKHMITGYLPGQVCYNLGEYPCRKPWDPDEWDERELDQLRNAGIRLVQIMEEWNDLLRLFGADKFTSINPAGLRRFIDMVHARGMKLLLYTSSGYIQRTDPELREEWARPASGYDVGAHWNMARCSPASPDWRAYLLPRMLRIMDDYGLDGLYNDFGYRPLYNTQPTKDEVLAFEESPDDDGALEDLISIIYSEVKRRGGIYKIHRGGGSLCPKTAKVWDYLWVGEGAANADELREKTKNYPPYVVPCFDLSFGKIENDDELYLHAIPYMQFPLLLAGRPFTGERATIPGVKYLPEERDRLLRRWREIWKYYQAHPEGPHSYGPWDSFPGRPNARAVHARWLKLYYQLVEEGTRAYLEITDTGLLAHPVPANVTISVFANRKLYLVLANYSRTPVAIETARPYVAVSEASVSARKTWTVPPRSLLILSRHKLAL